MQNLGLFPPNLQRTKSDFVAQPDLRGMTTSRGESNGRTKSAIYQLMVLKDVVLTKFWSTVASWRL
jgi:hypothetical protein